MRGLGGGQVFAGSGEICLRIAATIERALAARRPKARYAAGYLARPLLLLRRFGGDRLYDLAVKQLLR